MFWQTINDKVLTVKTYGFHFCTQFVGVAFRTPAEFPKVSTPKVDEEDSEEENTGLQWKSPWISNTLRFNGIQSDSMRIRIAGTKLSWPPDKFVGPWRHGFHRSWFSKSHLLGINMIHMGLFWKFRGTTPKFNGLNWLKHLFSYCLMATN